MELPEPLLPHSLSDPPSRRRRTSLSGKLLNLFSPKPKSPPEPPPRPIISRPQPLPSRIPVRHKRDFREVADENEPPPHSPRPRSRPRLTSDSSVDTVRGHSTPEKLHTPPRRNQATRPLKSALKKSTAENQSPEVVPASAAGSSRAASVLTTATPKPKESKLAKRLRPASWIPFSPRNQHPRASSQADAPSPPASASTSRSNSKSEKKRVAFAMDRERSPPGLRRTPSMVHISESDSDHWADIAMELDDRAPSPGLSSAVRNKRKAEDVGDPRYGLSTSPPGSPITTRKELPVVPSQQPLVHRHLPNGENSTRGKSKISGGRRKHADLREVPLPHADMFTLPSASPSGQSQTRMGEIADEVLREYARAQSQVFHPVVTKRGPAGVLQRISVDIVPNERHSTIWDANDNDIFAWGGTLLLRDSKPASYFYPRHCIQDVRIEFSMHPEPAEPSHPSTFSTFPAPSAKSSDIDNDSDDESDALPPRPQPVWRTTYTDHRVPRSELRTRLAPHRGIAIEPEYVFVGPPASDPSGPCAWLVHFWAPVPLSLFAGGGGRCRTFVCRAAVTVGDWDTPRTVVPAGCTAVTIEALSSRTVLGLGTDRDGSREERDGGS